MLVDVGVGVLVDVVVGVFVGVGVGVLVGLLVKQKQALLKFLYQSSGSHLPL